MNPPDPQPAVVLVPRAAQRRVRWKNDLGWTTELAARPDGASEFDWRVSIAEVDTDCAFSHFPGIDRSILVLAGAGFDLHVDGEPPAQLRLGGPAHAFSGDRTTSCTLIGGPTRDFNVMTRRGRLRHSLFTAQAPTTLERTPGLGWVVYVARGAVSLAGVRAEAGDCVVLEPVPEDMPLLALSGDAALVLVRLQAG
ncbi:HutD family protein [Nannocystis sp. SCPEA4]|uniref:HutD/Ves family protein n=1 Tax=Nannocystis sp. SCPEA4 TaxID=2996787 RepID=UPI00226EF42E|nr:HutD family protein [Nannocystis sp. SCPEA4]